MPYYNQRISLIIPTLNAEKYIEKLLNIIDTQTIKPDEIIVIDSASDDNTIELCKKHNNVKVIEIKREDFDHGGTRNKAIDASIGDIVLMLSQDVTPIQEDYIEKLISPIINDNSIAACSGRQIAYPDATLREKLVRQFNYKDYSFVRDISDVDKLGIKAFFLSDCCSAYRREYIEFVGKYQTPALICSDMILTAKLIAAGYKIAYVAEAEVYHSHDYSLKKQYKRNFDTGVDIANNEQLFKNADATSEGIKMTKYVLWNLLKKGHLLMAAYFCIDCVVRFKAHRDGKSWRKIPKEKIVSRTTNLNYWKKIGYHV